jgi:carbamoyltransferase
VSFCPHDGGLGLGAALFVWHHVLGHEFAGVPEFSPYNGFGCGEAQLSAAEAVVADLLQGRVVAWYNGRSENGKRALGNRSLLLDPRLADGRAQINRVKRREWFRPFAPSVLAGHDEWCEGPLPPSPYMSFASTVREEWRERVPAITHIDGTCRPQIVTSTANPVFHRIISLFYEATGIPMILNTSYNVWEPIIDTPENAHRTFEQQYDIDVLYVNGVRTAK